MRTCIILASVLILGLQVLPTQDFYLCEVTGEILPECRCETPQLVESG